MSRGAYRYSQLIRVWPDLTLNGYKPSTTEDVKLKNTRDESWLLWLQLDSSRAGQILLRGCSKRLVVERRHIA